MYNPLCEMSEDDFTNYEEFKKYLKEDLHPSDMRDLLDQLKWMKTAYDRGYEDCADELENDVRAREYDRGYEDGYDEAVSERESQIQIRGQ